jgi:hypothetical protein
MCQSYVPGVAEHRAVVSAFIVRKRNMFVLNVSCGRHVLSGPNLHLIISSKNQKHLRHWPMYFMLLSWILWV